MGKERGATTRMRLAGKICALCGGLITEPPEHSGERICGRCEEARGRHRVLMNFQLYRDAWRITFLEADCRTSLPRKLNFASEEKIFDLARRGGACFTSEARSMMEHAIQIGRGGIWLALTDDQYQRLRRR